MLFLWAMGTYVPAFVTLVLWLPPQHIETSMVWHAAFLFPSLTVAGIGTLIMREGCVGGVRGALAGGLTGFSISIVSASIACEAIIPRAEPAEVWYAIALTPLVIFSSVTGGILGTFCRLGRDRENGETA